MFKIRSQVVFLCVILAGLLTACNSSKNSSSETQNIVGAGSTFINPLMTHWIPAFQSSHPGVQINYQSIGSGGGIQQLKKGLVDFGASDAALDDQQLQGMPALVQIPESAGPVCITYNLPELKEPLKLSGETLARIYLGEIKTWQDPAIKKDNAGVKLPNDPVVVAHRSDGSGTTNIFTTYLAKISPDWEKKVGKGISVSWPVGVGGKGSEGVTGSVKQTPGAIGYVELSYATENKLPVAEIKNRAGEWIAPTAAGATAAIDAFSDELAKDVRIPIVDPPASAKEAYPISGLTYLLVPKQGKDPAKEQVVKEFIQYIVTQGQDASEGLQYSKLPASLTGQDEKLLAELQTGGQQTSMNQGNGQ
ncbi:MAG TPA: phosphate ABC transporter substrate-binding protein PstS [Verrucomicrobiae bacterium]|jgi:phosphate transport system substrate-binding protein|nr:phosphate ABC transporter substrate-binding protein PstS [Verrucomicrobiae bacterium]